MSRPRRIRAVVVVLGLCAFVSMACSNKVRVKFKARVKDSGTVTSSASQ